MSQSCHCEAPQGPWQSRRTVLNFRKISANSKHFTGDSHVASLLGMTKRRLFAIPRIPRCFPLVFPPKPPAGLVFRHPDAKTKCTARQAGRSACQKVPSGLLPSCLQNCKTYCVVLFCNFAAAAGYLTRKDALTVSCPSFLPSETSGWAAFSPARFAKSKCTARQAGRYISKKRKKEREKREKA